METLIKDQWAILAEFDPEHKVKLVIDEWGSWHPEGTEINKRHLYEQMSTLRDALVAALTLDTFNRHAEKVDMANVAQLINNLHSLFLADGDRFVATPNFHVYTMYRPHQGGKAVRDRSRGPRRRVQSRWPRAKDLSRGGLGFAFGRKSRTLTLVHTHATEPAEVLIRLRGGAATRSTRRFSRIPQLNAHNTFEQPDTVVPKTTEIAARGAVLNCVLPPASINRFDIGLM